MLSYGHVFYILSNRKRLGWECGSVGRVRAQDAGSPGPVLSTTQKQVWWCTPPGPPEAEKAGGSRVHNEFCYMVSSCPVW